MIKLHLGCGTKYLEGYINTDLDFGVADLVFNLERLPWPLKDRCAAEVLMENILEHLPDLPAVMDELHRITRPGGRVDILVPHFSSFGASTWFDHKQAFHYNSLAFCDALYAEPDQVWIHQCKKWKFEENRLIFLSRSPRFKLWKGLKEYIFNRHKNFYTTTGLAYMFPAYQIRFVLRKEEQATS